MLNDVKTGLTIWKNITNVKYTAVQIFLFAAAGFGANVFAAPRLYERAKIISAALHMGVPKVITALAVLHIIVFGGMMRQIVYEGFLLSACGQQKSGMCLHNVSAAELVWLWAGDTACNLRLYRHTGVVSDSDLYDGVYCWLLHLLRHGGCREP